MRNKTLILILLLSIVTISCSPQTHSTLNPTLTITPLANTIITPEITPTGIFIESYQNVCSQNLMKYGELGEDLIKTLTFDQFTIWSASDQPIAQTILEQGKNPGMGVRELHEEGISGKGITVAIIDQHMNLDHPEFQGKIIKYIDFGSDEMVESIYMHGPAVTSLLVGNTTGTAPDARVYYAAVPSWLLDAQYYADALDWLVAENEKLPEGEKIRVVSVSAAPSGIWSPFTKNMDAWDAAYMRATEAGLLVLDCTFEEGITLMCTYDLNDPDNMASCIPNWDPATRHPAERINIPTSRTTATERMKDGEVQFIYRFSGYGGLSWSTPYLAGVLAMGWQVNPELSNNQILTILRQSAYLSESGQKIIDPRAFIERVKLTVLPME
jgi:serine protease AprX